MSQQVDDLIKAIEADSEGALPVQVAPTIAFDVVELQKISLAPGDTLAVKLIGDDFDVDTMTSLRDSLTQVFTKNKVMVFTMPKNSDIQFSSISEAPAQASYCSDCSCGKKERAEGT